MADRSGLLDNGRSLDMMAAKRNPRKNAEPITMKNQPQNVEVFKNLNWAETISAFCCKERIENFIKFFFIRERGGHFEQLYMLFKIYLEFFINLYRGEQIEFRFGLFGFQSDRL